MDSERNRSQDVLTLVQVLTTSDQRKLRQQAAQYLGQFGASSAFAPLRAAALFDPHRSVRATAAYALGNLGDPQAIEPLLVCLSDRRGTVRKAAAQSLRWFRDPRIIEPLLVCLHDRDRAVRANAALSLGAMGHVQAIVPLLACLQDQNRPATQSGSQESEHLHTRGGRSLHCLFAGPGQMRSPQSSRISRKVR